MTELIKMFLEKRCVIRTENAGVHVGTVVALDIDKQAVVLREGRRIYRWRGANTLDEVATDGIDSAKKSGYTRVSNPTDIKLVLQVIEVIPATDTAWEKIITAGWAR